MATVLSVAEAARRIGVPRHRLDKMKKAGLLDPCLVPMAKRVYVDYDHLLRILNLTPSVTTAADTQETTKGGDG